MSERMESHTEPDTKPKSKPKTLQVVPAEAGPDIQPVRQKRPMTEAQLAALKRGRERLAEKRKAQHEEGVYIQPVSTTSESTESTSQPALEAVTQVTESTQDADANETIEKDDVVVEDESDVEETFVSCVVM